MFSPDLQKAEECLSVAQQQLQLGNDLIAAEWFDQAASIFRNLKRFEEAITAQEKAITIRTNVTKTDAGGWSSCEDQQPIAENFDQALYCKPDLHQTWCDRGDALYRLGDLESAIASYDQALQHKPDFYLAWNNRGATLLKLGDFEGAVASCEQALRYKPDFYLAWNNRGLVLLKLGDFEAAITNFDQALHYKPDFHEAWRDRGDALFAIGILEGAIASYDQALQNKPDYYEYYQAWYNRGVIFISLGDFKAAITNFDQALHYKPDLYQAWHNRGDALLKQGDFEAAITNFDQALHYKPDLYQAWGDRGTALSKLGNFEDAVASYDQALYYKPDYQQAWHSRGTALSKLGNFEDAVASYDQALYYKLDLYEAWYDRGDALRELGDFEGAIVSYDQALHYKPDFHEAWNNRGNALGELGNFEGAIASYDQALHYKPDFHEAWNNRAFILVNLGELETAITNFDQALYYKPDSYLVWNNRGIAAANSDGRGKKPLAFSLPPEMQNPNLDERGYEGRLASIHEGFRYVAEGTEGWGLLYSYIGDAHRQQARNIESPRSLWRKASVCYKTALQILTSKHFPEHHLTVLENLITVLYALQETDEAKFLQREGSTLIERLLSDPKCSLKCQKILQAKQATFAQISVDLALRLGDKIEAFNVAENGKNTCLLWMLNQLPLVIYDQVQRWIPKATAMLYWHISPNALTTFVILPNTYEPIVVPAPLNLSPNASEERSPTQSQIIAWENWLTQWNNDYQSYTAEKGITQRDHPWRNRMRDRLSALKDILNISEIETILSRQSITQLILVPHRDLHCFPLHTFFTLPCTYLPSAYFGINAQPNPISLDRILLIENPKNESVAFGGGTFVEIESALIQTLASTQAQVIDSDAATLENVESALRQTHHIFHFTGHAAYNSRNPEQSCLFLAGRDQLSLQTLAHLDLSSYHLISLAACETGVTGKQTITDEYVGLPSAFLKANASRILSTFWRVESAASAFVVVEFYRSLQSGISPAIALQHAQTFLKTATCQDLITWIDAALSHLPESCQIALRYERDRLVESKIEHPYDHPYYWAAFSITGL